MSLRWRSAAERKMPRLMRSRSILLNQLDLVEPGGVGGSEVQADVGVKLQELLHSLCLVGREVVQDDVDLLARRLLGDYRSQEGDELLGGMPGGGAVRPITSPVLVLSAAYRERVPLRTYSKPWRSKRPA